MNAAVMANSSEINRKKCKGLRRSPPLKLWMWCIVIKYLISLPCIFSSCQGIDLPVSVYPKGLVYVTYGKPLELFCVTEKDTAENLRFELNNVPYASEIVNSTTRRLYIEHLEKQVYTFYCNNTKTKQICTSRVLVDTPPGNITDFSCISSNLDKLNCTWTSPKKYIVTNYSLSFSNYGNMGEPCLAKMQYDKTYWCAWDANSQPRYRQMEDYYYFHMKSCNKLGCNYQNFTIKHYAIVKPDPPINLRVLRNSSHSVLLQWNIPNNLVDFLNCAIVHKIEYQIGKIDNTAIFHTVNATGLPAKNRTYRFLLSNLPYAHMRYEVRVYIRSELATEDRFWSDRTFQFFQTASEIPQRPPETVAGAFDQSLYNDKRVIYVYWKQLEEFEEAGANFTYRIVATQGSKNPQTVYPDKNKSLSYVVLDDASLEAIDIAIWSTNSEGSSVNSSHLHIPARRNTESLKVHSFTKLAYENGTYKLSWIGIDNIDNYTLFWCYHNSTQICAGRLNFTVLDARKNSHVIHLPTESRYQFAIAANKGPKTYGMSWAICDISKDGIPIYGFPLKLDHDIPGTSYVKITWKMSCTLQEGIIKGYLITYCPVSLDTGNMCDSKNSNSKNKSVHISDPKQMEVNITDLKPYRTYQFTLALNTSYGLKTIENASTGVTTTEDTPSSPRNITISNIFSDSLVVSWDPPLDKNGVIGKYVIFNNNEEELYVDGVADIDKENARRQVKITGLKGFTNYTLSVKACNTAIRKCSEGVPHGGLFVRTRIGPPGKIRAPNVRSNPDLVKWESPEILGGAVDLYQIKRVKDDNNDSPEIFNTTNLLYSLTHCEGVVVGETYQVRAVNFDEDLKFGTLTDKPSMVIQPERTDTTMLEFPGEWSDPSTMACRNGAGITMSLILLCMFALIVCTYGSIKLYKKYRKMEDIKPVLPSGLDVPEKDLTKYAFGVWNPSGKDDKPSSDEMLLLPNSRTTVSTPENKQSTKNNCGSSDHTDSTALSDTSRGPVDRQTSTSDDGSDSSLHLEEPGRIDDNSVTNEEESSNSETDVSRENSPYFSDRGFKKNPTSGYVQTVASPTTGYVQSAPVPPRSPVFRPAAPSAGSSYVMAALSPPIFTTGVAPPSLPSSIPPSSGYVRPEDAQAKTMLGFPKLGPSPTKAFGSESLPTMPTLPQPVKSGADSSYIQLQSLDALPSHKQPVRNAVPLKPQASSGYVSPGEAVINKHLNNMLSGGQLAEESAILDPTMSPDAYCRFSWSTDPANDNLHSLLSETHTINSSKN